MSLERDSEDVQNLENESDGLSSEDLEEESDSDDNDDELVEKEIIALKEKLCENPYDYETHLQLIETVRKSGDLIQLRECRENMAKNFPLTPDLWLQWIKDESGLVASAAEKIYVFELFERATKDYVSVDIWLEYVQYALSLLQNEDGLQKIRDIFERAVSAVGLHVGKGSLIWEAFRDFENNLIEMMPDDELKDHYKRIYSLFKRQFSVPLLHMEHKFEEFTEWMTEVKVVHESLSVDEVKYAYDKALVELQKLKPYEDALLSSEKPSYDDYTKYIEYEEANGTQPRVQTIYERAILDHCLVPELWLKYTSYLDLKVKIPSISENVYDRALRNCPWIVDLWINYIKSLERFSESKDKVTKIFEKALESTFQTGEDYKRLWLCYLDYLRRRTNFNESSEVDKLKKCFETANNHLINYNGDPDFEIFRYLAKIEAKFRKNMENARKIWKESLLIHRQVTSKAEMWIEYANLERVFGEESRYRNLLLKGLQSVNDWPESIGEILMKYEREEGSSIEALDEVVQKYEKTVNKINAKRLAIAEKEKIKSDQKSETSTSSEILQKKAKKRKLNDEPSKSKEVFKVPLPVKNSTESTESKRTKVDRSKDTKASTSTESSSSSTENVSYVKPPTSADTELKSLQTVFVSNLDFNTTEDTIRDVFSQFGEVNEVRLVRNYKKLSKGFCYVEFNSVEGVKKALKHDRMPIDGRPVFINEMGKKASFKYKSEKNTLFVKNVSVDASKEDLYDLFVRFGEIKEVRLVTYRNGHSKGLAYIEFADELGAQNGLKADELLFKDKNLKVALSNPPEKNKDGLSGAQVDPQMSLGPASLMPHSSRHAKAKINVPMIPTALRRQAVPSHTNGSNQQATSLKNSDFRSFFKKDSF